MEEIINSIMRTPDNTNPNVLRSQLQGIASSSGDVLVVHVNDEGTMDKTWQEIHDADFAVIKREIDYDTGESGAGFVSVMGAFIDDHYIVLAIDAVPESSGVLWMPNQFGTDSADGYPSYEHFEPMGE